MTYDPITLDPEQMGIVQAAAASIPPGWRPRFLAMVADGLIGRRAVTEADLRRIVSASQRAIILGQGPAELGDD